MIIGHGDIASVLTDRPDVTFFASGVSNSRCTDVNEFERECKLLMEQNKAKHIVYFSSLCIYTEYFDKYYHNYPYAQHKRVVEAIVRNHFTSYTIIRLGNIAWGKNPNTLINYLATHPGAPILKVWRHIIEKDEFLYWMNMIPVGERNEMNLPGKRWWVPDLVDMIRLNDPKHVSA